MSGQSGIFNSITAATSTPYVEVGTKRVKDGKSYVYLQNASTSTAVAIGAAVYYKTGTSTVTDDVANSKANMVAGINATGATVAASYYFWALTKGRGVTVKADGAGTIAAGDAIISSTTGTVKRVAAGTAPTYKVIGWAEADDTPSTGVAVLASVDIG